jgi:hypothetical protein
MWFGLVKSVRPPIHGRQTASIRRVLTWYKKCLPWAKPRRNRINEICILNLTKPCVIWSLVYIMYNPTAMYVIAAHVTIFVSSMD